MRFIYCTVSALIEMQMQSAQKMSTTTEKLARYETIELPGVTPMLVARAYIDRGRICLKQGNSEAASSDFTHAIDLPGVLPQRVANALLNRAILHCSSGNYEAAVADCTRVMELHGISPLLRIKARIQRGLFWILASTFNKKAT
jgi:hypothetical protein